MFGKGSLSKGGKIEEEKVEEFKFQTFECEVRSLYELRLYIYF